MASLDETTWRKQIFTQLQQRNRTQTHFFQDIVAAHSKLFDSVSVLKNDNLQLSLQNEKLKTEGTPTGAASDKPPVDSHVQEKIQCLEQKLLTQQEELTEMHRRKGENAQQIIDLNAKMLEKDKLLEAKETALVESLATNTSLRAEIRMYENSTKELHNLNQTIHDEHQALQLAFVTLEGKLRAVQEENRQLLEKLMMYKSKDAEKLNEENDNYMSDGTNSSNLLFRRFTKFRKKNAKVQKELEEACKDIKAINIDEALECGPLYTSLPTEVSVMFDAHEGEVNAVKWSPVERIIATGGADRKVQFWDISKGSYKNRGTLVGSNAGIMSIDFDSTGSLLLGASNDFASRVWTVGDLRLRHTLTGHSGKVLAGKFLGQSMVVTGSYDRTLKIWDLRSKVCIQTKFAGSSCNDLVTMDGDGSTIISGHYDKRIRFWDTRSDTDNVNDIILQGKVTSLDLTRDNKYLVACVRDDTLKLIDLRMNQIVLSFSNDDFKVGCDWTRASFSPDGQYIAVGSFDGCVFIWNVNTAKVERVLKAHGSAVTATAWDSFGSCLASVDRTKKVVVWGGA